MPFPYAKPNRLRLFSIPEGDHANSASFPNRQDQPGLCTNRVKGLFASGALVAFGHLHFGTKKGGPPRGTRLLKSNTAKGRRVFAVSMVIRTQEL